MLEDYIRERLREKEILLMAHIVVGYPSIEDSFELVRIIVEAGADLMELQIPFSEPIADGPVILKANQEALAGGITVQECIDFGDRVARRFDIPFLFMTKEERKNMLVIGPGGGKEIITGIYSGN